MVGKTCLFDRFTEEKFNDFTPAHFGVDFRTKTLDVDGKMVKLQIWDTPGQEIFRKRNSSYYKGADGFILVYDITNLESFQFINSWLEDIKKSGQENKYKILVGNKCDLKYKRKVTVEQGKDFASEHGMKYFEVSAKDSTNVSDLFFTMTRDIINITNNKKL